ncbi:MAG: hypothetical protein LBE91_07995 [Tannerella sp.]|nr:hypothetical protein [Tannerella sp.]
MDNNKLVSSRFRYIIIHLAVCTVGLILVNGLDLQTNFRLMQIFSFWSILIYLKLLQIEIKYSKGLTLVLFYLIGCLMRVGMGGLSISIGGINNEGIFYLLNDVTDAVFPTSIWMNISYMLFLASFTYFTGNRNTNIDLYVYIKKYDTFSIAIFLYILSYLLKIFPVFTFMNTLNQILGELSRVSLLLLTFTCVYKRKPLYSIVFILTVIAEIMAGIFGGFYKGGIISPLFFVAIYFYLRNKQLDKSIFSMNLIAISVVTVFFLFSFVYPFMNEKRYRSGYDPFLGGATKDYSNMEIIEDVLAGDIKYDEDNEVSDQFVNRVDAIATNSFFYKNIDKYGKHIYDFIEKSLLISIPKILYPDKPLNDVGMMATALAAAGNINTMHESSYTFVGFFASMYMLGGVLGVFVLCLLNGIIIAKYYNFALDNILNPFSLLLLLVLLFSALSAYEETTTAGIASWIWNSYYIIIILFINFILKLRRSYYKYKI